MTIDTNCPGPEAAARALEWASTIACDDKRTAGMRVSAILNKAAQLRAQAPQGEPVAWGQLGLLNGHSYLREAYQRSPYPPPSDIVKNLNLRPLFTHPDPRAAVLEGLLRRILDAKGGTPFELLKNLSAAIADARAALGEGKS